MKRITSSVGTVIIFFFLMLAFIATISFLALDYNRKLSNQLDSLGFRLDRVQSGFIDPLANTLWKLDNEQTEIILQSILRQKDIEQVRVEFEDKYTYYLGKSVDEKDSIVRKYPIHFIKGEKKEFLGTLQITATKKYMKKYLEQEMIVSIGYETTKVFVFIIFTFFFIKIVVIKHLDSITEFFKKNNIYDQNDKLALNRKAEFWKFGKDNFDQLVESINGMTSRLQDELLIRKRAEADLKKLNITLEKRVEQKTAQLLETDRIEAVVELSAGIAHEINSPLSVVHGLNSRIEKMAQAEVIDKDMLGNITKILDSSVTRIFAITNALQMLSNISKVDYKPLAETSSVIDNTMEGINEIFRSSIGEITYLVKNIPGTIYIDKNVFYQLVYMLIHIRQKGMDSDKSNWIRLEFEVQDERLLLTCFDSGKKMEVEERAILGDAFKSSDGKSRGSLLLLGTFSSFVNKLGAKINFMDDNEDVFLQVAIPVVAS